MQTHECLKYQVQEALCGSATTVPLRVVFHWDNSSNRQNTKAQKRVCNVFKAWEKERKQILVSGLQSGLVLKAASRHFTLRQVS